MALFKYLFGGFYDPALRPRWIIWTAVAVIVLAGVMIPVLGITSTRWFCSNACHKVQDDTIKAYQHSTHSEISCMACHMPVDANPVVFLLHKAEALGELVQTVTNNYSLPLNPESEVSLTMPSGQCTQCHNEAKRNVSPDPGLKINHQVHADAGITCPTCHNRIAHNEDFVLTGVDPKTGQKNKRHTNFMEMTACFRCHTQDPKLKDAPPGDCFVCHTPAQRLVPASHLAPDFFPKGHGKLGLAAETKAPWMNLEATSAAGTKAAEEFIPNKTTGEELKKVDEINYCSTCHAKDFCTGCHGVPMPHPDPAVWDKTHGPYGRANPQVCAKCHGLNVDFCGNCHHGTHLNYNMNPKLTWKQQHPLAVNQVGASSCIQPNGCHGPTYCALCHANGGTLPPGAPAY